MIKNTPRLTVITNPPYGERLGTIEETEKLYRDMGRHFKTLDNWQIYVITSHEKFERLYGRPADKKKKLYNGMIPCTLYQFFKPYEGKPYGRFDNKKPYGDKDFKSFDRKPNYQGASNNRDGKFGNKNIQSAKFDKLKKS